MAFRKDDLILLGLGGMVLLAVFLLYSSLNQPEIKNTQEEPLVLISTENTHTMTKATPETIPKNLTMVEEAQIWKQVEENYMNEINNIRFEEVKI